MANRSRPKGFRPQLTHIRMPLEHTYPNACMHDGSCGLDGTDPRMRLCGQPDVVFRRLQL